jgi:FkbM family methyltransferase
MLNTLLTDFVQHMNRLTPDHFVIDLGANVGLVSECLAKSGAKVVSFEPNHYVFAELKKWHQDTEISKFETLLLALKTTK